MATTAIVGLLATTAAEPLISSDMPWFAQFGLCGLFGALLWWKIAKTDIQISADHKEGMKALGSEISGLRDDVKDGQAATTSLLREALFQNRHQ